MLKRILNFIGAELLNSFESAVSYTVDSFGDTPGRPEPEYMRRSRIQAAHDAKFAQVLAECGCEKCCGKFR